jgi:hypothetical protein
VTIRPIENPETGFWEILQWTPTGKTFPLPSHMRVQARTKRQANESTYMVAEQLGSLGFVVHIELLEED